MFEFLGSRRRKKPVEADAAADRAMARVAAATDIAGLIDALRDTARAVVVADGISIARRDGETVVYENEDAVGPLWTGQRFSIGDCVGGIAIRAKATIVVPDILTDHSIPQNVYLATFVRSMAVAPIGSTDPRLAIGAYWQAADAVTPAAVERLNWLAACASDALARIQGR